MLPILLLMSCSGFDVASLLIFRALLRPRHAPCLLSATPRRLFSSGDAFADCLFRRFSYMPLPDGAVATMSPRRRVIACRFDAFDAA